MSEPSIEYLVDLSNKLSAEIERLEEENERLKSLIRRILKHIETGLLVRDVTKDGDVGWALPVMRLVVDLKNATEAVE